VKNIDLWQRLDAVAARHDITWIWVRGHSGHLENERADALARARIAEAGRSSQAPLVSPVHTPAGETDGPPIGRPGKKPLDPRAL